MDLNALFKISHGVYVTGAKDEKNRFVGSCVDAVMVVEAAPARILISMGKSSYTCETVLKTRRLTLSVLPAQASNDLIRNFGMQSSRTIDKWDSVVYTCVEGLPVLTDAVAYMTLHVADVQETETHYVFLCDVKDAVPGTMGNPLIYQDYKDRKEKTMSDTNEKKWVCTICGYVYDGEVPFEELPDTWVCPLCGEPKSVFVQE